MERREMLRGAAASLAAEAAGPISVEIQPAAADRLRLLVTELSSYDANVTYKLNGAGNAIPLTGPQIFSGGATALFGGPLATLEFSVPTAPVQARILAVRDAVA